MSRASLTVAHVDAEAGFSGGEVQVFLLMEGLRRRGHENVLFCRPGSRPEAEALARGIETRPVPMRSDVDLASVRRLRHGFAERGVDLVHLHTGRATWLGGLAARWAGLPSVTTRRMDRPVRRGLRTRLLYRHLVRRAVAISPAVAERLQEGGVPPDRTCTIWSSVDPEAVRPERGRDALRAELGLAEDELCVLTLVSLVPRKGIDVLVDAVSRLADRVPALRVLVAGEGPEHAALEARAARGEAPGRVRFLGARSDRGDLLAAADVFCLPSRAEGLGVAALEAQAAGLPVVASRVGGLAQAVVHGETGLLVEPEDPAALAEALARLALDPGERRRLGAAGRERVVRLHDPERMVDAYADLYASLLAEEPGDRGAARKGASP